VFLWSNRIPLHEINFYAERFWQFSIFSAPIFLPAFLTNDRNSSNRELPSTDRDRSVIIDLLDHEKLR